MSMRRRDLLTLSATAALLPWRAGAQVPPVYQSSKYVAPKGVPSRINIAPGEPGERLIVTGKVMVWPRGLAGASLYVFHADREGRYTRDREGPNTDENARLHGADLNRRAEELAVRHGKLRGAGSDAHTLGELGNAFVELAPHANRADALLTALVGARVGGSEAPRAVHLASTWAKVRKVLPGGGPR